MILAAIGAGLFWAYQKYYLQTINSISIEGDQYQLVVSVDTEVDDSKLSVICMDNYGNAVTRGVVDGKATFTDLLPDSLYRIQLDISGFHKLVGQTSDIFTTKGSTRIASFSAITGAEDGSVMLNFAVSGADPEEWVVSYSAEGEETQSESFSGHTVTVRGLTVGKLVHLHAGACQRRLQGDLHRRKYAGIHGFPSGSRGKSDRRRQQRQRYDRPLGRPRRCGRGELERPLLQRQ